jgi:Membrane protein involved in the export of O-antigen and teichoic acid
MGKYKTLLSNTMLFAIASFSSKLLVFFLMPFYTSMLKAEQYGTAALIQDTCNFILPIMYLSISEAIIRFGLERHSRKKDIYTSGMLVVLAGFAVLLLLYPVLQKIETVGSYLLLVYLYVLASAWRTITTHFVRACGYTKLFALDGTFTTLMTILFNVWFLLGLKMKAEGLVLATICADALSALCLTVLLKTWRAFKLRGLNTETLKAMLRYSLPLVPTAIFWWVTNLSDRYFITYMIGLDAQGVYSAASKIPSVINILSAIFIQAWQISAFREYNDKKEASRFYSTIFKSYYTLIFLLVSALIFIIRPFTKIILRGDEYYIAWTYSVWLLLSVAFSCLVTFLGTIYNAEKKNAMVTITTGAGALLNLVGNYLLIPKLGPQGAAIATFLSFLAVFLIRLIDTRKYIRIAAQPLRLFLNLALLLIQIQISLRQMQHDILWQALIVCLIFLCNFGYIMTIAKQLLRGMGAHSRPPAQ